jgi:hypothetical protein
VIQAAFGAAVQPHPAGVFTVNEAAPPADDGLAEAGVSEYVHETPACSMAIVCPAMVIVPDRGEGLGFGATV